MTGKEPSFRYLVFKMITREDRKLPPIPGAMVQLALPGTSVWIQTLARIDTGADHTVIDAERVTRTLGVDLRSCPRRESVSVSGSRMKDPAIDLNLAFGEGNEIVRRIWAASRRNLARHTKFNVILGCDILKDLIVIFDEPRGRTIISTSYQMAAAETALLAAGIGAALSHSQLKARGELDAAQAITLPPHRNVP